MKIPPLHPILKLFLSFIVSALILLLPSMVANPSQAQTPQKRIVVNLTEQKLYAYQDNQLVHQFNVSTGKLSTPTPRGGFWPWIKLPYDRMTGGSYALDNYYDLPNVPHVVYMYNQQYPKWMGYAIHGTYWHNNFGHPMSHGCINLSQADAATLYPWIDLPQPDQPGSGTMIIVTGQTPTT